MKGRIETTETPALLSSTRKLRRVLETRGYLLSLRVNLEVMATK